MKDILLLKNQGLLREGIMSALEKHLPTRSISAYGEEAFPEIREKGMKTLLAIVDMELPYEKVQPMLDYFVENDIKVAVWVSSTTDDLLTDLFKQGFDGYFYNGMEAEELVKAIEVMCGGKQYVHPALSPVLLHEFVKANSRESKRPIGILTDQEWKVLELVVEGEKNATIGEKLYISPRTVNNHIAAIFRKLKAKNRLDAAIMAIRNNWIEI